MQISNFLFVIVSLILSQLNSNNYEDREKYRNVVVKNMYLFRYIKADSAESSKSLRNLEYFECSNSPLDFYDRLMFNKLVLTDREALLIVQSNTKIYRKLAEITCKVNISYSYPPFTENDLTILDRARKKYVENPKRVQTIWKLQSIRLYK
jgi:hypothetical protein